MTGLGSLVLDRTLGRPMFHGQYLAIGKRLEAGLDVTLRGRLVTLTPPRQEDVGAIVQGDDDVLRAFVHPGTALTAANVASMLANGTWRGADRDGSSSRTLIWAIRRSSTGGLAGLCGIQWNCVDTSIGRQWVVTTHLWLLSGHRSKGYGAEAGILMLDFLFRDLDWPYALAVADSRNVGLIAQIRRAGARHIVDRSEHGRTYSVHALERTTWMRDRRPAKEDVR